MFPSPPSYTKQKVALAVLRLFLSMIKWTVNCLLVPYCDYYASTLAYYSQYFNHKYADVFLYAFVLSLGLYEISSVDTNIKFSYCLTGFFRRILFSSYFLVGICMRNDWRVFPHETSRMSAKPHEGIACRQRIECCRIRIAVLSRLVVDCR